MGQRELYVNDSIGGPPILCDSSKNLASLSEIGQNDAMAGINSALFKIDRTPWRIVSDSTGGGPEPRGCNR
jgi:hypothetical protein